MRSTIRLCFLALSIEAMHLIHRYGFFLLLVLLLTGCSSAKLPAPLQLSVGEELILAAKRGDGVAVWAALAAGASPNTTDRAGNTALIFAARDGHLAIAEALIDYGALVDWQDDEQVTPLILAASRNHPDMVTLLLSHGADPDIKDQWGRVAKDYATRRGDDDPIARMLEGDG